MNGCLEAILRFSVAEASLHSSQSVSLYTVTGSLSYLYTWTLVSKQSSFVDLDNHNITKALGSPRSHLSCQLVCIGIL